MFRNADMKGQNGFTLLELILVVAIVGTILAIVTLNFHQMNEKYRVESCTREIYTILMKARNDASRTNTTGSVVLTAHQVTSAAGTVNYPRFTISFSASTIVFNSRGILDNVSDQTIFIEGYSADVSPAIDCIVISATRINMGKKTGVNCAQR